jgi:hypothetical protein
VQWLEEVPREGEVAGSNSAGRWGPPPIKKNFFPNFFGFFFGSNFVLLSARQKTLGKDGFADYFFTE